MQSCRSCAFAQLHMTAHLFIIICKPLQKALLLLHLQICTGLFVPEGLLLLLLRLRQVEHLCLPCSSRNSNLVKLQPGQRGCLVRMV